MQQQPLPAVLVEVVVAVADTLCLTLNRNLDVIQVPQRSITLESSCCPEVSIGLPDCQLAIQVVLQPLSSAYLHPP
jgi:hypothetical protein